MQLSKIKFRHVLRGVKFSFRLMRDNENKAAVKS